MAHAELLCTKGELGLLTYGQVTNITGLEKALFCKWVSYVLKRQNIVIFFIFGIICRNIKLLHIYTVVFHILLLYIADFSTKLVKGSNKRYNSCLFYLSCTWCDGFIHSVSLNYDIVSLPDEGQRNHVVGVNCNQPVTVFTVWVRVWIVWRQDKSRRPGHIPTTWGLRGKEGRKK